MSFFSGYDSYVSSGLPSPTSPHPSSLLPSPSSNIHFTFPSLPYPEHVIKEEPSPWTVPSLDLPSTSLTSNDHFPSSSPMLLSPAVSNLNTPRVSLSSTRSHGSHPDLSSRLRSSHSSLHSASASPLPYSDSHCPGTFGHSVSQYSSEQGNFMELSPPNPLTSLSSLSSRFDLSHHFAFHILPAQAGTWLCHPASLRILFAPPGSFQMLFAALCLLQRSPCSERLSLISNQHLLRHPSLQCCHTTLLPPPTSR